AARHRVAVARRRLDVGADEARLRAGDLVDRVRTDGAEVLQILLAELRAVVGDDHVVFDLRLDDVRRGRAEARAAAADGERAGDGERARSDAHEQVPYHRGAAVHRACRAIARANPARSHGRRAATA